MLTNSLIGIFGALKGIFQLWTAFFTVRTCLLVFPVFNALTVKKIAVLKTAVGTLQMMKTFYVSTSLSSILLNRK